VVGSSSRRFVTARNENIFSNPTVTKQPKLQLT
jgi:hypothetical protein